MSEEQEYFGFTDTEVEAITFLTEVLHNKGYAVVIMHPRNLMGVSYWVAESRIETLSYFVLKYGTDATRALAHLDDEDEETNQE